MAIYRWGDVCQRAGVAGEVDEIFFGASETKSFESDRARLAFRERWLGRYLMHFAAHAYVAIADDGHVAGYVVGSLRDPARDPLFQDLPHFAELRHLTARFPAQLHVNVGDRFRGLGLGARLVETFVAGASEAGARGVHVVTARGMRNVGFYLANGFREEGILESNGRVLLLLGRSLT
ncbi:MAG: GNAT family N-acetyltransferase [Hyphomicrobium sp.]